MSSPNLPPTALGLTIHKLQHQACGSRVCAPPLFTAIWPRRFANTSTTRHAPLATLVTIPWREAAFSVEIACALWQAGTAEDGGGQAEAERKKAEVGPDGNVMIDAICFCCSSPPAHLTSARVSDLRHQASGPITPSPKASTVFTSTVKRYTLLLSNANAVRAVSDCLGTATHSHSAASISSLVFILVYTLSPVGHPSDPLMLRQSFPASRIFFDDTRGWIQRDVDSVAEGSAFTLHDILLYQ
ncbi:hypothetical protein DFH06DRAFT_1331003 [Mycena polygramma]|nr:hypothetical protein DFH06DRAFT_1331003 [Mycena polygramma]